MLVFKAGSIPIKLIFLYFFLKKSIDIAVAVLHARTIVFAFL